MVKEAVSSKEEKEAIKRKLKKHPTLGVSTSLVIQKTANMENEYTELNEKEAVANLWGVSLKSTHMKKKVGIPREPKLFVNHWDVCLNSKSCFKVLQNRGLSVHFLIDNDGTIYQTMDMQHIAFHAGNHNDVSIGVEISNAYYPKYQG